VPNKTNEFLFVSGEIVCI